MTTNKTNDDKTAFSEWSYEYVEKNRHVPTFEEVWLAALKYDRAQIRKLWEESNTDALKTIKDGKDYGMSRTDLRCEYFERKLKALEKEV